jgi:hypothetical protein
MTSAARRLDEIFARYGEVNFEDPLHYEGPLELTLMHAFGPAGLTTSNCEPFERFAHKLWEGHETRDLTPVLLIVPKVINESGMTTGLESFITAVDAANPTFVSRLTSKSGTLQIDPVSGRVANVASTTIALKARAARANGHMLADGGYYEQSSGSAVNTSHSPVVLPEIPLYIHGADEQSRAGKLPDPYARDEPVNYLAGEDSVVYVGWPRTAEIIFKTYEYSERAETDERTACQLAINACAMLRDIGFSLEQTRQKSPHLARHIENMQTISRMLSLIERAGQN